MATKKTDKKAVKKVSKKITSRKLKLEEPIIVVPQGGQVIGIYELTPNPPKECAFSNWDLVNTETSNLVSDEFTISFCENSSSIQRELERAVLVINIVDSDKEGRWRFALHGINICSEEGGQPHGLEAEILNYGKTLVLYLHSLSLETEKINFSFVGAYTDANTGLTTIYESKDPVIWIRRP